MSVMEEKKKRWRPSLTAYRELEKVNADLRSHLLTLEQSNTLLEDELKNLRSKVELMKCSSDTLANELHRLSSRGFFARLFNK